MFVRILMVVAEGIVEIVIAFVARILLSSTSEFPRFSCFSSSLASQAIPSIMQEKECR